MKESISMHIRSSQMGNTRVSVFAFTSSAARRIWNMRKSMWIILSMLFVARGFSQVAQAAPQADHFKALGPDRSQAREDSLFSPADFEAAAASHPDPNGLTFFSLCRRAFYLHNIVFADLGRQCRRHCERHNFHAGGRYSML